MGTLTALPKNGPRTAEEVLVDLVWMVNRFLSHALPDIPADDPSRPSVGKLAADYERLKRGLCATVNV